MDFSESPTDPLGGGCWTLDFSESPTDPLGGGGWTLDFKKERNQVEGGGCYKVTLVSGTLAKRKLCYNMRTRNIKSCRVHRTSRRAGVLPRCPAVGTPPTRETATPIVPENSPSLAACRLKPLDSLPRRRSTAPARHKRRCPPSPPARSTCGPHSRRPRREG